VQLLAGYSQDPALDVRIIIRNIGDIRKTLESIKVAGFDMARVKVQVDCHTKGIVIDSETVLLGSHNWTDQGVQVNRDASLLIRRPEIARYYERVFLHDWERLARFRIDESAMPVPPVAGIGLAAGFEPSSPRARRIAWSQWLPE
jgi:phosphatidylserine/phosphatidylglycerophosphate/cardiolipin synthase-like enzyme